jgi:hypothetical protein
MYVHDTAKIARTITALLINATIVEKLDIINVLIVSILY